MLKDQPIPIQHHPALKKSLLQAQESLNNRQFFKLICGGSLTDVNAIERLVQCYLPHDSEAVSLDCIDIAPEPAVVEALDRLLTHLENQTQQPIPLLMVSIPLDPDPHFRKIAFDNDACIGCNACIPVCPTQALSEGNRIAQAPPDQILVNQPLCYGCNRCVVTCPTEALSLYPIYQSESFEAVLTHPRVGAVEIHTRYADPYMLADFLKQWQPLIQDKLVSLCFRPTEVPASNWRPFIHQLQTALTLPLVIQIDGQPMSGRLGIDQSKPALEAARQFYLDYTQHQQADASTPWITISGGVNPETAAALARPEYHMIQGVGMGGAARELVWHDIQTRQWHKGQRKAQAVLARFKSPNSQALAQ
jgi:formate hydrogenlyase subunit 6/NADH:ubiquinone oxidoreductase subunit I